MNRVGRMLVLVLCSAFGLMLLRALQVMPENEGLTAAVALEMESSGVSHGVTAVLLNFRGYDTFFEIGVLLLALVSVWYLGESSPGPAEHLGSMKVFYLQLAGPGLVMFAGFLLWIGSRAPGGAFQGGAILAALGVLTQLSGIPLKGKRNGWKFRALLAVGLFVFFVAVFGFRISGAFLLEYPREMAGGWILAIEGACLVSIGLGLSELFRGQAPDGVDRRETE